MAKEGLLMQCDNTKSGCGGSLPRDWGSPLCPDCRILGAPGTALRDAADSFALVHSGEYGRPGPHVVKQILARFAERYKLGRKTKGTP